MSEAGEVGRKLQSKNAARDFSDFGGRVFLFLTQHARRLSTMCMSAVIVRFPHDAPTLPLTGVGAFSCPGVRLVRLLTLILQE